VSVDKLIGWRENLSPEPQRLLRKQGSVISGFSQAAVWLSGTEWVPEKELS